MTEVTAFLEPAVVTSPTASIHDTVAEMASREIGVAAVVTNLRIVGIVTERDLVRRAAPLGTEASALRVADAMTREVVTVPSSTSAVDAVHLMREKRIRHLAIVDYKGCYVGMVALRRLVFELLDEMELKIDDLTRELMADGPGG